MIPFEKKRIKIFRRFTVVLSLIFFICHTDTALGGCGGAESEPFVISRLNGQLSGASGADLLKLLIQRGEAYQSTGHFGKAASDFSRAFELADETGHQQFKILGNHALGYLRFLQGDPVSAEALLRSALAGAQSLNLPVLTASCTHRLGTVLADMGREEEAYLLYRQALDLVRGDPGMEACVLRNLAHIMSDDARATENLVRARNLARQVQSPTERKKLLLGIGAEARIRKTDQGNRLAFDALNDALSLARDQGDLRRESQALGGLGALYESLNQFNEAYEMTGQALEKAQAIQAHDLLIQWEWQLGRLLKKEGKQTKAVAALRRAVYQFQTIRNDIPMGDMGPWAFFRGMISSIHQALADILLSQASGESQEKNRQIFLREAQEVIEGNKRSELRDYFRDPCIAALSQGIGTLSPNTAVLYPILLPDRLELLVEVGGTLVCKTSPIPRDRLEDQVRDLAKRLRKGLAFKAQARTLFDGLIRPVTSVLDAHEVKTLVHVPDGVLRLIPLAALMDEDVFLVERYSLATVPGLTLLDPAPLGGYGKKVLLAGISDPGPVIYDLPQKYWDFFGGRTFEPEKAIRGLSLEVVESADTSARSKYQDKGSAEAGKRVRRALALPGVKQEIERLSKRLPGKVLFNETFGIEAFSSELLGAPYSIVHIASHGFFGGGPEQNFIMAFDKCLDMNFLEGLIRPKQLAEQPVELISLSACQTAEGDEKSPLGLTGVALKSGARSALGSLWPVSDKASQELFPIFYALLDDPHLSLTKADSLQRAQLSLLRTKAFQHPFYWSAFILVGNWL